MPKNYADWHQRY